MSLAAIAFPIDPIGYVNPKSEWDIAVFLIMDGRTSDAVTGGFSSFIRARVMAAWTGSPSVDC